MKVPKATNLSSESSFGLGSVLGIIFILIGILLVLSLMNYNLPIDLTGFEVILQYGAAIGSIFGGLSMLFKKKETIPNVK